MQTTQVFTLSLTTHKLQILFLILILKTNDWQVDFNLTKTPLFLISCRQLPLVHPPLDMNNVIWNETTSHRHLGLIISNICGTSRQCVLCYDISKVFYRV